MKTVLKTLGMTLAAVAMLTVADVARAGTIVISALGTSQQSLVSGTAAGLHVDLTTGSPIANYKAPINIINNTPVSGIGVEFSGLDLVGNSSGMVGSNTFTIYDGSNVVTGDLTVSASVTTVGSFDFLNMSGVVSNVVQSNVAGGSYDWALIDQGTIAITESAKSIQKLVNHTNLSPLLTNASFEFAVTVPEPSSFCLAVMGGLAVGLKMIRRRTLSA